MTISQRVTTAGLIAILGCSDTADTTPGKPEDTARSPRPSIAETSLCGIGAGTIVGPEGIGRLRIGATIDDVRAGCRIVRDTMRVAGEGMRERRITVDLGRDTVETVVVEDRIRRIHVDGPAFRTADDMGVGTTVDALRRSGSARVLAGEGSMFLTLADECGLSFRLGGVPFGPERPAADLPGDGHVVEVLVFGCEATNQ